MVRASFGAALLFAVGACAGGGGSGADDVPGLSSNGSAGVALAGAGGALNAPTAGFGVNAGAPAPTAGASAPAPTAGAAAPTAGAEAPTAGSDAPIAGAPAPVAGEQPPAAGADAPIAGTPTTDNPNPATPAPAGSSDPIIPAVTAQCPAFTSGTITFMGLGGIALQAGPKAAGPTAPMVFYWHGTGSTSGEYALMAGAVQQGVAAEGGVLISFQGTTGGDLLSGTAVFGMGDLALTDQLAACAVQNHNVDSRRIFATGCSAGGLFSTAMAALRSNYVAAAAPNSGGLIFPQAFQGSFVPSLMTIHGAPGVDVVVIDFSQASATADDAFKSAGGFVINCNHGGGHCGGGGLAPDIWEFFKAHPYGTKPSPWAGGLPAGFNSVCKIY